MPYRSLPAYSFWKNCREATDFLSNNIYQPKFNITRKCNIATAGSCFAQHLSKFIKKSNANFLDVELAPFGMSDQNQVKFGYGVYSARYGNIYSARQLDQLLEEVIEGTPKESSIWEKNGRYFDAIRPTVEPLGLNSASEVLEHRTNHLQKLNELFSKTDVFIFTLGLTEMWCAQSSGTVFPTCPGLIAHKFDPKEYQLVNAKFYDVYSDIESINQKLRAFNPSVKILLTVSPVPLTATANKSHVLLATQHSKSVLRAAVGEVIAMHENIDYFPSYELVTGLPFAHSSFYKNLRSVSKLKIKSIMSTFFAAHPELVFDDRFSEVETHVASFEDPNEQMCEELLLEAFAN